jgi:GntR family transcriptional regulator of vanillate catabolism
MTGTKTWVAVELRKMIVDGVFSSGDRIAEIPLAERLEVSRTPVRAALAMLEQEGLLLASPTGGYTVQQFTLEAISDAIDVRGTLEGLAARQLAESGLPRQISEALNACIQEGDSILSRGRLDSDRVARFAEMNIKFHGLIVEGSGNLAIKRALAANNGVPFSGATSVMATLPEPLESYQGLVHAHYAHKSIVDALVERQGARSEALMREHANANKTIIRRIREKRNKKLPGTHLVKV